MKFKKVSDNGNALGFDSIEILQFNYDGAGAALVKEDGRLSLLKGEDLDSVLFGVEDGHDLHLIYKEINGGG